MKILKILLFGIMAPVMFPLMLFLNFTFGDKDGPKWFQTLWKKKGNYLEKSFALLVSPIFLVSWVIMRLTYKFWDELLKDK